MLTLEHHGNVAVLTLDRQAVLNALSFELIEYIGEAIDRVAASEARALIITGAGAKAFCAGADIAELTGRSLAEQKRGAELGQRTFAKLDHLAVPSVALVNGYAFGGGTELALACTFRLATPNAKFGLPEIKLGLIPGYGGATRLPRLIGQARAMDMILSGRTVAAEEALQTGLVNKIVEGDPLAAALDYARQFTGFSLIAAQLAREAVQQAGVLPLDEGLRVEAALSTLAYRSADAEEGMLAFLEKRPPRFLDR